MLLYSVLQIHKSLPHNLIILGQAPRFLAKAIDGGDPGIIANGENSGIQGSTAFDHERRSNLRFAGQSSHQYFGGKVRVDDRRSCRTG